MATSISIASPENNLTDDAQMARTLCLEGIKSARETAAFFYNKKTTYTKTKFQEFLEGLNYLPTTANYQIALHKATVDIPLYNLIYLDTETFKALRFGKYREIVEMLKAIPMTVQEVRAEMTVINADRKAKKIRFKEAQKPVSWQGESNNRELVMIAADCEATRTFVSNLEKSGLPVPLFLSQINAMQEQFCQLLKEVDNVKEQLATKTLSLITDMKKVMVEKFNKVKEIVVNVDLQDSKLAELEYQHLFLENLNSKFIQCLAENP